MSEEEGDDEVETATDTDLLDVLQNISMAESPFPDDVVENKDVVKTLDLDEKPGQDYSKKAETELERFKRVW